MRPTLLKSAGQRAAELDCPLELAVFLPGSADEPRPRSAACATAWPPGRIGQPRPDLAFSDAEESSSARTVGGRARGAGRGR